jgi:SAM-dependent methyltransferase
MIDQQKLLAEIEAEVERRRLSGELTPAFERELDDVFNQFAPPDALEGTFAQVVDRAEQVGYIDTNPKAESARPGVPIAKKAVLRSVSWIIDHVGRQVSEFSEATTRALRLLGERVDVLEASIATTVSVPGLVPAPLVDADHWASALPPFLAGIGGRVLHGECGDGAIVRRLVEAGVDAYGVDPDDRTVRAAAAAAGDIRTEALDRHLERTGRASLGAIVVSGYTDRCSVAGKIALVERLADRLAPGGLVVAIVHDPTHWANDPANVTADLSPGGPLRAATWNTLFTAAGFEPVDPPPAGAHSFAVAARR